MRKCLWAANQKISYQQVVAGLRSNRGKGLFLPALKQKADGRAGSWDLSLKQDGQRPLELSRQIEEIVRKALCVIVVKFNHVPQSGRAHACACCGVVVHAQALP